MGWYDAYKIDNTSKVNLNVNSNGSAAKTFGDAFKEIGSSLIDSENRKKQAAANIKKENLLDIQTQTAKANLANINSETEQKAEEWVQKQDNQDYLSKAFGATSKEDFEKNYPLDKTNSVTPDVIKKADDYFQAKFNDEAINTSINGGYKSYKDFATANPELVKNADGTTMAKISKQFADNDIFVATLKAQQNETKHQQALLKKDKEILKLTNSAANKGFVYGENTDTKIANIVAKGMGLDTNSMSSWSKDKQAEFMNISTKVALISKTYGLTPLLAIKLFNEENTKVKEPEKTVKKTWANYQD